MDAPFWHQEGRPETQVQRAAHAAYRAWDWLGDVECDTPDRVLAEAGIADKLHTLDKLMAEILNVLKEVDARFCDLCGNWTDEPMHKAHCGPKEDADEYDIDRDMRRVYEGPGQEVAK